MLVVSNPTIFLPVVELLKIFHVRDLEHVHQP